VILPPGFRLDAHDMLGSTSDHAKALAAQGAPAGLVVLARVQTAGRGRLGRAWRSLPGNLHLSVLLRPAVPLARAPQAGFVVALAVAETVDALLGREGAAKLKWPNDVMLGRAKLAGILCEAGAARGALDWLVAGIGLNLAAAPEDAGQEATCLAAAGRVATPEQAVMDLLPRLAGWLDAWQEGFAPVRAAWLARAGTAGVRVRRGGSWVEGRVAGLEEDGALVLEGATGRQRVAAGEAALLG
jgi:BirA family biotin operon repressor/biotin-[acetyl-CoA-carboxylase] ligase